MRRLEKKIIPSVDSTIASRSDSLDDVDGMSWMSVSAIVESVLNNEQEEE